MVRTNGWLSEVVLDEIQRKIMEKENTEEPRIELRNICNQQKSQDEDDVELMNIENLFNRL